MSSIYGKGTQTINTKKTETKKVNQKDTKKIFLTSVIVSAITVAILIVFSYIALSPDEIREVYTKLVLLPIAAFVGSFVSCLMNKDFFMNLLGNAAVLFFAFFIFVELSFTVILWLLFYAVSAVIGIMTAYIAKTFR